MSDRIDWLKDTDEKFKKSLRGHDAEITVAVSGKATLVIDGGVGVEYDTLRMAKNAFRKFLLDKPVA